MEFTRWYDKDEQLKALMQTLEHVNDDIKLSVAADLLQMVLESKCPNTDDFIDDLNAEYLPVRRRWYDRFETLHSTVEIIKNTEGDEKRELIKEIMYSIFYFTNCKIAEDEE
jgi:hypothetical protein